jgi:hypothetical protein
MPNYYQKNRYPRYVITGFVGKHSNLERARPLSATQISAELDQQVEGNGELVVRQTSNEQKPLTLAFQRIPSMKGEPEYVYALVYLAPSLAADWLRAMDLVQDDFPWREDDGEVFDIHKKGNELRDPAKHGQWQWAFYLRAMAYAAQHQVQRWQELTSQDWQALSHLADQDVAALPEAKRDVDANRLQPALVPITEEMQDAFDAYCALDVNNRVVPAHIEAAARLRLWRANHPNWFRHVFDSQKGAAHASRDH